MRNKVFPSQIYSLNSIHLFLHEIEAIKRLLRHSWLSDGRQESVAEHTWRMCLMAMVLNNELEHKVDLGKVVQMITVHDLAEARAGDYHAFEKVPSNKHQSEQKSLKEMVKNLNSNTQGLITKLWKEFEEQITPEAKFAQALDKLEVLIQHNEAGTKTWEPREYDFNYFYGYDKVNYSKVLTLLRDLVLEETIDEIEKEEVK